MATEIRSRQPDDLPACVSALKEVHAKDGYPVEGVADALGWLTPPGLTAAWIAEVDGRLVGHALVSEPREEEAVQLWHQQSDQAAKVLARLFVLPEARGARIGELLTLAATKRAKERGQRLVLDVMEKDRSAIRLYQRLGWVALGAISHKVGGQTVAARAYVSPP